ncbi:MAG: hypothetical protein ACXAEI_16720 [Candidatus Hodarchaeales archaeon]|jgi:hypothetical protein
MWLGTVDANGVPQWNQTCGGPKKDFGSFGFDQLVANITEANNQGVWALYKFIYDNKELDQLNESFEFGHSSLSQHLLIIANLIVQDSLRATKN